MMKRPITTDAASAASATTAQPAIIAVTRPGERGTAENDRIDFAVNNQRYAVHSATSTGKPKNSSGLRLNAANSSAATTM